MKDKVSILLALLMLSTNIIINPCLAKTNTQSNNFNKGDNMQKIIQTAGRVQLGDFAPEFAKFNDDVLFGENWNNQDIDLKTRSIITVVSYTCFNMKNENPIANKNNDILNKPVYILYPPFDITSYKIE